MPDAWLKGRRRGLGRTLRGLHGLGKGEVVWLRVRKGTMGEMESGKMKSLEV